MMFGEGEGSRLLPSFTSPLDSLCSAVNAISRETHEVKCEAMEGGVFSLHLWVFCRSFS